MYQEHQLSHLFFQVFFFWVATSHSWAPFLQGLWPTVPDRTGSQGFCHSCFLAKCHESLGDGEVTTMVFTYDAISRFLIWDVFCRFLPYTRLRRDFVCIFRCVSFVHLYLSILCSSSTPWTWHHFQGSDLGMDGGHHRRNWWRSSREQISILQFDAEESSTQPKHSGFRSDQHWVCHKNQIFSHKKFAENTSFSWTAWIDMNSKAKANPSLSKNYPWTSFF